MCGRTFSLLHSAMKVSYLKSATALLWFLAAAPLLFLAQKDVALSLQIESERSWEKKNISSYFIHTISK